MDYGDETIEIVSLKKAQYMSSESEETSKLCSFCGKSFSQTSGLNKHKKVCKMGNESREKFQRICVHCGKNFAHRSSLYRHEQICKSADAGERKFKCPVCFAAFARVDNYKRHYRDCNPNNSKISSGAICKICHKRFSSATDFEGHLCLTKKKPLLSVCLYEDCKMTFYRRSQLTRHLRKAHSNQIEEERILNFSTMEEFFEWKRFEEQTTFSVFTKRSGTRGNTDYYYCQLDGSSKPHCKKGEPARKTSRKIKKGTIKQDKICLAKMVVKIEIDGACKVIYQPTHSHKLNITAFRPHILLTDTVKYINEQLSIGVPPKKCIKSIIDGAFKNNENQFVHSKTSNPILVSGINAMALCKRVKMRNNKDDAISVMIRVALLSKERVNPVILYKPLGEDKVIGPSKVDKLPNSQDLFMLGIQTGEQRSMMLQCSRVIISINWVDDTNAYGYRLLSLVVPDEHNRGYPVAYFILNHFTDATLCCCFLSIKENCPDLNLYSVITPDDNLVVEALKKSFKCDSVTHIVCLYSVLKTLQRHLENTVPKELVPEMFQSLCGIIECKDELEVVNMLEQFTETYFQVAPTFVTFLKDHYVHRIDQWTMAYRNFPHGNVDTTVFNEATHSRIKVADMNDPNTRRLDDLLNILLDMEEDDYKRKFMEEIIGIPYGIGDVPIRHTESLKISDDCITQIHDSLWEIKSEIDPLIIYEVVKCRDNCTADACYFVCNSFDCGQLCSHLYACTCQDKNPLCVHVHKIRSFLLRESLQYTIPLDLSDDEPEFCEIDDVEETPEQMSNKKLDKIQAHLEQLSAIIQNEQIEMVLLDRIENCLQQLLKDCGSLKMEIVSSNAEIPVQEEISETVSDVNNQEIIIQDFILKDDPNRYEFEYKGEDSDLYETNSLTINEPIAVLDMASTASEFELDVTHSFTPSLSFSNLTQTIIKIGTEELSLLHLKSLEPFLTDEELAYLQECDQFRDQHMYAALINTFFLNLQLAYNQIVPIHSDIAVTLKKNGKARTFFTKELLEKDILIMPMNLTNKYWTCVAVFNKKKQIVYFNPFGKMTKKDDTTIRSFLNSVSEQAEWNITIPNYNEEIENDGMGFGVHVCYFAEQIAKQADLMLLKNTKAYRKHIYDSIVGGCLKRDVYDNLLCGKCNSHECPYVQDDAADLSISCGKCNQWYHNLCIGISKIDICNMDFICPP